MVADKDVRLRWDTDPVTIRVDPVTRRTVDVRRNEILREYWIKSAEGDWYRVPRVDWESAAIGRTLRVRPALPERAVGGAGTWPCVTPDNRWGC